MVRVILPQKEVIEDPSSSNEEEDTIQLWHHITAKHYTRVDKQLLKWASSDDPTCPFPTGASPHSSRRQRQRARTMCTSKRLKSATPSDSASPTPSTSSSPPLDKENSSQPSSGSIPYSKPQSERRMRVPTILRRPNATNKAAFIADRPTAASIIQQINVHSYVEKAKCAVRMLNEMRQPVPLGSRPNPSSPPVLDVGDDSNSRDSIDTHEMDADPHGDDSRLLILPRVAEKNISQ